VIYIGRMKQRHRGGLGRHGEMNERSDRHHHHHHSEHHHRGRHRGGRGRLFDYGELRLVLLSLIADEPRHGYEVIKLIEERSGGSYDPSPGVIYPTLSWLDDMGYARIDAEDGGRKRYSITKEGKSFLDANRASADELIARLAVNEGRGRHGVPSPVLRAMENFRVAMRLRLKQGNLDEAASQKIATALDEAAKIVEKA
jgi:DNA-binding PadR family transcriptional regulator